VSFAPKRYPERAAASFWRFRPVSNSEEIFTPTSDRAQNPWGNIQP
jgi:hypothetical protein